MMAAFPSLAQATTLIPQVANSRSRSRSGLLIDVVHVGAKAARIGASAEGPLYSTLH